MARKSSIDRLPAEIKAEIGRLRQRGASIDEILKHLQAMPNAQAQSIKRSALGLHTQKLDQYAQLVGESRDMADALIERLGESTESKVARLNIEMMQAIIHRIFITPEGEAASFDAQELHFLARTLKDLGTARKSDIDAIERIEQRAREAALAEAKSKMGAAMKRKGLSADAIAEIEAELGANL